jgi:hypothetical protein
VFLIWILCSDVCKHRHPAESTSGASIATETGAAKRWGGKILPKFAWQRSFCETKAGLKSWLLSKSFLYGNEFEDLPVMMSGEHKAKTSLTKSLWIVNIEII